MKKKRIFKKLGSHESPCHSRMAAMRVKRSCEDYVRKLEWIHKRAVEHLKRENEALRRENKRSPHPFSIPAANTDFAFVKFWLAGYYQTLRTMKAMGFQLSVEAQQDFNNVKAFLKQFDGNIDKWAEIRVKAVSPKAAPVEDDKDEEDAE